MHAISLLCATLLTLAAAPALAGPLAYVPNEKSASVSVIDTATDQRLRDLPLGERPRGIAAGGGLLYLTDGKTGQLLVVEAASGRLLRSIAVGASPEGVSLSPDGRWLAVAVEDDNSVVLLTAPEGQEVARISGALPAGEIVRWVQSVV